MVSEKDCRWRDSPPVRCSEIWLFCKKYAPVYDVIDAGEAALVCLYSGKEGDNPDGLRYAKFCDKVATNKVHIRPQTLPPTSVAARYHSMRVYLQVQQWLGVCSMNEPDWGGWQRTRTSSLLWRTFLQHQTSCSVSSDATAQWLQHSQMQLSQAQSGVFPCMRSVLRYRMFQQHRGWYKWRRRRWWWWRQIIVIWIWSKFYNG